MTAATSMVSTKVKESKPGGDAHHRYQSVRATYRRQSDEKLLGSSLSPVSA